jgi:hypothetical protein
VPFSLKESKFTMVSSLIFEDFTKKLSCSLKKGGGGGGRGRGGGGRGGRGGGQKNNA